jgi:hypothetical protein
MSALASLMGRSESATLGLARVSQAAVLQAADWSHRRRLLSPRPATQAWLAWLTIYVEEPARLAARPYTMWHDLLALHREFSQRLLEIAEGPGAMAPKVSALEVSEGVVVDLASAQRRRAATR